MRSTKSDPIPKNALPKPEDTTVAERFQHEIARSVAEYEAYLDQYGSLTDAIHRTDPRSAQE